MSAVNTKRVALGALAGGVVWSIWSSIINVAILAPRYAEGQNAGLLLKQPRYPFFVGYWFIVIFLMSWAVSWLYSSARATRGASPGTALTIGLLVGFAAACPVNLTVATWFPVSRYLPLWWMLDMWVGAILASLVAGWVYRD